MGAEVQVQSNLFLPFGKVRMGLKVRMGYPLGRLGWVLEREGLIVKPRVPFGLNPMRTRGAVICIESGLLFKTVLLPILTLLVYHRLAVYDVNALWEFQNLCQGHVPAYEYSSRRIDTCIVSISHNLCYSAQ